VVSPLVPKGPPEPKDVSRSAGAQPTDREPLLHALADSSPAILWITDRTGACTFVSRRWTEQTGQTPSQALGDGWLDQIHPDDRRKIVDVLRAATERREPFAVDCRIRDASGGYRWAMSAGRPHVGAGGEFLGMVGAIVDIDDRKRAEIALRRTQQVARFLANASAALTEMADARSILHRVASLAVPFFADWAAVDVLRDDGGLERLLVVHSETRKAALAREIARHWLPETTDPSGPGRVARTGEPELVTEVQGGLLPWARDEAHAEVLRELGVASYLAVAIPWRPQARAVLTLVVSDPDRRYDAGDLRVAEDLALRTSVAIDNAVLYRTALEADRRKDEFLAVLSHELRTPLNAIVGWTHVLREGTPSPETLRKAVDIIHRNAQVQTQLISDILDISRIVAGKLRLDVRPVDLAVVVEAALDTLRPAAQAKRVRIETVLDPRAGPISGDTSRLQQIVSNLASNAIKFVAEKVGRVHVRLEAINSHVRLTVEDNGPGIDPAFLPHVFERFRQADSSSNRAHQGLGLGLAIVRQLVELHGGTVRADNRAGGTGAIFTVELPRRSVATAPEDAGPGRNPHVEPALGLSAAASLAGLRLLVVDDSADARDLLKAVLERCGAAVTTAASAREGLAALRTGRPDALIADIEMPEESGYDLIHQVRALPAEGGGRTPAVALTAYATAHDRVQALRAGFQTHIPKPVQPAELAAVVASLCSKPGG
jgi:PAS domain S-box-containing protein